MRVDSGRISDACGLTHVCSGALPLHQHSLFCALIVIVSYRMERVHTLGDSLHLIPSHILTGSLIDRRGKIAEILARKLIIIMVRFDTSL